MQLTRLSMSDVVLVGDLHCGLRGANPIFEKELEHFLYNELLPDLKARTPLAVIFLGDLFDDRRAINLRSLDFMKRFLDELDQLDIVCYFILGNHDIHYRDTLQPNSVEPLLREYRNLFVIAEPTDVRIDGKLWLLVPWICKENEKDVLTAIEASDADYLCGHFDIVGFEQQPGVLSTHGLDLEFFSKFSQVFSGHYHVASQKGNVRYVGTPYQMTRADDGITKAYIRWNNKENQLFDRMVNHSSLFSTIRLNKGEIDGWNYKEWMLGQDHDFYNKIITLVADENSTDEMIEYLVRSLEEYGAYDIKVVDTRITGAEFDGNIENLQAADTLSIIRDFVDNDPDLADHDRDLIKRMLAAVYQEALGGSPAEI